jgi:hypothetical protein
MFPNGEFSAHQIPPKAFHDEVYHIHQIKPNTGHYDGQKNGHSLGETIGEWKVNLKSPAQSDSM